MGRLLLTSSQVGVVLSGLMILACTSALFLAGYTIQQNTVRHLRAAIRPRVAPAHTELINLNLDSGTYDRPATSIRGNTGGFERASGPSDEEISLPGVSDNFDTEALIVETSSRFPGLSEDQATFDQRRAADKARAGSVQGKTLKQQIADRIRDQHDFYTRTKLNPGPYLGSIIEEAKRHLRLSGVDETMDNVRAELEPEELSTAERRKLFKEQLASGQSPDVVKKLFDYRRRGWLGEVD